METDTNALVHGAHILLMYSYLSLTIIFEQGQNINPNNAMTH
jgi:hypothetical protein